MPFLHVFRLLFICFLFALILFINFFSPSDTFSLFFPSFSAAMPHFRISLDFLSNYGRNISTFVRESS